MTAAEPLLSVRGLVKHFPVKKGLLQRTVGQVHAVDGISFDIAEGETLGLVGESGCGKSVTALSVLRLIPSPPGRIVSGTIRFAGKDLLGLSEAAMRDVQDRGAREPPEHGGAAHRERQGRQDEVREILEGIVGQRHEAPRGQEP